MSNAPDNIAALPKPERPAAALPVMVDVNNPTSLYLDTAVFNQIQRVAVMMTRSGLAPAHLRSDKTNDRTADCILVVAQALRWRSDPFAVAQHTFVTQGKLGYEGKLIAAMVNASGKLQENLNYEYSGDGDGRKVVVSGKLKGGDKLREIDGTVAKWKTANEFWKKNPDQMLAYRGAREWARRHMPEVLLGVNSEEEIAPRTMVDVTPQTATSAAALTEALAKAAPPPDDLRTIEGQVVEEDELTQAIDAGDASDADTASRERTDTLIAQLANMPTLQSLNDYKRDIAADLSPLPDAERGRFNTAYIERGKALKATAKS